ncbi:uncharacterized protein [Clytia hemisphaerica]|uniref:uncharacterized protein isoform X2 n=1 Tax=Clytia hemisphaerica TaxID=252671 RepID=UPI0034D78D69
MLSYKTADMDVINTVLYGRNKPITSQLDPRVIKKNYTFLMLVMQKILYDTGHNDEETVTVLDDYFKKAMTHYNLSTKTTTTVTKRLTLKDLEDFLLAAANNDSALNWLRLGMSNGCGCLRVLKFNLKEVLSCMTDQTTSFIDLKDVISKHGCVKNTLKYRIGDRQPTCFHVKLSGLNPEVAKTITDACTNGDSKIDEGVEFHLKEPQELKEAGLIKPGKVGHSRAHGTREVDSNKENRDVDSNKETQDVDSNKETQDVDSNKETHDVESDEDTQEIESDEETQEEPEAKKQSQSQPTKRKRQTETEKLTDPISKHYLPSGKRTKSSTHSK